MTKKFFLLLFLFTNLLSMESDSCSYEYFSEDLSYSSDYDPSDISIDYSIRPFFKALGVDNYPLYNKKNLNTIDDLLEEIKYLLEEDVSKDTYLVLDKPFTFLSIALNVQQDCTKLLNVFLSIHPFIIFEVHPQTNENIFDHLISLERFYRRAPKIRKFLIDKALNLLKEMKESKDLQKKYKRYWKRKRYWKKVLKY